jgi:TDG/mug DNA glycosylase family protein
MPPSPHYSAPPSGTLPDYLRRGLAVVSVGLNPSLPSVRAGFYFANPRNRFWRAFNASGLVTGPVVPGVAAMQRLLTEQGIGFTDLVKRPTAGAGALRAADFRQGAPVLEAKLLDCAPAIVWFHGRLAWDNYRRYVTGSRAETPWGEQPTPIGRARVFVTPNPSPANAVFSLADLTAWYRRLRRLRDRLLDA